MLHEGPTYDGIIDSTGVVEKHLLLTLVKERQNLLKFTLQW